MRWKHERLCAMIIAVLVVYGFLQAAVLGGSKEEQARRCRAFFPEVVRRGFIEGIRAVELIRPDILAVTIDPAITKWGFNEGPAGESQTPEVFTVTSSTDTKFRASTHPAKVGRRSFEYFNGVAPGPMMWKTIWWHTYYLYLPTSLASGHAYTVKVAGIDKPFRGAMTFAYDERETPTKASRLIRWRIPRRLAAATPTWDGGQGTKARWTTLPGRRSG